MTKERERKQEKGEKEESERKDRRTRVSDKRKESNREEIAAVRGRAGGE